MTPEEFLSDAASRKDDDLLVISVRELLALWGHVSRGPAAVAEIGKALAGADLTTEPDFRTVPDMRQTVQVLAAERTMGEAPTGEPDEGEPEDLSGEEPETSFPRSRCAWENCSAPARASCRSTSTTPCAGRRRS